ncbi:MAG: hypothetical protein AB7T49_17710 [Oligoflexales bacterium]
MSKITVSNDGVVHAQYFCSPKEDTILGTGGTLLGLTEDLPQNDSSPAEKIRRAASNRSKVCSVSGLVEEIGRGSKNSSQPTA